MHFTRVFSLIRLSYTPYSYQPLLLAFPPTKNLAAKQKMHSHGVIMGVHTNYLICFHLVGVHMRIYILLLVFVP